MVEKSGRGKESMALETVKIDEWYAFTVNLGGDMSQWLVSYNAYDKLFKEHLSQCAKKMDYVFVPEYSKLGRFHVHGKVRFHKKKDIGFFYSFLGYLQCNYEFDVINDTIKWDEYMYKQREVQERMAAHYSRPYEITSENHRMDKLDGL